MAAQEITIIIVDDHPLFRQGVANALSLEPDVRVLGQAGTGEQGLEMIRDLQPKVAIVDINLPGMNGQQLTRQVVADRLPSRVILLTAYDDRNQKIHAMRVGAAAFCTKDIRPEALAKILRSVALGRFIVDGEEMDAAGVSEWVQVQAGERQINLEGSEVFTPLSRREMEVLICLARGFSNKEIAMNLGISHQTVKNHVTAILDKLGVQDRTQAALFALQQGWVRLQG
jgi:DNA-binding NarL/FixJ family response regulator